MQKIFCDKNLVIGKIHDTLYGSFIEHLGRAVYSGIYEPSHPLADENGFRKDVIELVKELGVTIVRYPGGNFVSNYDWKDGIGKNRKRRLELAWKSIETNEFGTDEFIKWCNASRVKPMLALNMGTATPKDALEFFEYCNHPSGTYYSDLRIQNGAKDPYNVKYWCLGNEMDGPWQICHMDAQSYAIKAGMSAKMLRDADAKDINNDAAIKLVICGSSSKEMPTFPEWDKQVLEENYDNINYISMHRYYEYIKGNENALEEFFSSSDDMNEFIDVIRSTIKYVKAKKRSNHDVYISFDEWNIWKQSQCQYEPYWRIAPNLAEDVYTYRDTLVFAGLLNTLVNNCDIVHVACLAQLVNVIAPIMTIPNKEAYRQGIFYPFKFVANNAKGVALKTIITCKEFINKKSKVLNVMISHDEKEKKVNVFIVNYDKDDDLVEMQLRSFGNLENINYQALENIDLDAYNDINNKESIKPINKKLIDIDSNGIAIFKISKYSFNFLEFKY